jgi:putative spermidine/putrescine transport system permease protein
MALATAAANGIVPDNRAAQAGQRALLWLLIACGLLLVFLPLLLTLYLSVFDENIILFPPRGYTLRWYGAILPQFGSALRVSLEVALAAVAISLAIGVPAGIGLSRYRFRGRGTVSTLLLAPLTVPGVAIGLGIYCLAVMVEENTGAPVTGGVFLLVAGHVLITLPWVVRLCLASLVTHERAAEEAAASLGARPLTVIRRVTLPAMRPGIFAGALFAFIISFENFDMSMFLVSPGVTTLPIAIVAYLEYHVDPLVAALAVAQIAVIGAALILADRAVRLGAMVR